MPTYPFGHVHTYESVESLDDVHVPPFSHGEWSHGLPGSSNDKHNSEVQ